MLIVKFAALDPTITLFREFSSIGRLIIDNDSFERKLFNNQANAVILFRSCFQRRNSAFVSSISTRNIKLQSLQIVDTHSITFPLHVKKQAYNLSQALNK